MLILSSLVRDTCVLFLLIPRSVVPVAMMAVSVMAPVMMIVVVTVVVAATVIGMMEASGGVTVPAAAARHGHAW
jgi:hypothetical protein